MNPYQKFVDGFTRLMQEGRSLPLGGHAPVPRPILKPNQRRALIFAPHPDDECIIGGLPLRLMREADWSIVNVAVTQGSNPARQFPRYLELQLACNFIGFGLIQTAPNGLEKINPKTRAENPAHWSAAVETIVGIPPMEDFYIGGAALTQPAATLSQRPDHVPHLLGGTPGGRGGRFGRVRIAGRVLSSEPRPAPPARRTDRGAQQ